ncbi:hypothetical protein OIU84_028279 [Salix udensis]|uniref:Pentatricopeptide repeat-containing protein n=1 Tax=Salix udensis TaxID=889485 RepID=A0AAD6P8T3_9ROSI|nr:hypothetical protein OIU84_028279 [Salix udensis]
MDLFNEMVSCGIRPDDVTFIALAIEAETGRIDDALVVVKNMPMRPSGSIWGSLLNSCRLHSEVPLAEAIAKRLFEIEPYNPRELCDALKHLCKFGDVRLCKYG